MATNKKPYDGFLLYRDTYLLTGQGKYTEIQSTLVAF